MDMENTLEDHKQSSADLEAMGRKKEAPHNEAPQKEEPPQDPVEQIRKELESCREETRKNYDLYLRALAETENMRRRNMKDMEQVRLFSLEKFFKDVLPVLDSFDKAFSTDHVNEEESLREGLSLVHRQLSEVLRKNGLTPLEAQNEKFDPHLHQAIKRVESEGVQEELVQVEFAKGYLLHEKLIRPAIVSVLVPPTKKIDE
ncbi:MAG: nucleotide exchange factor GrpE [Deltaproteobacteria bacterium]|nr:nucleotide exchange factor GrpE [Deltaproteobacteria bacterium]